VVGGHGSATSLASVESTTDRDQVAAEITLTADPTSAAAARAFVTATLRDWGLETTTDIAVLLADELVTNAIVHAGSELGVTVVAHARQLRVNVSDASHALPVVQEEEGHLRESGRGLHLVDALATAWGVIPHAAGKTVWFELARSR
jgi:anti-sigma regulatory factor (Ser/Thr protein kinase)